MSYVYLYAVAVAIYIIAMLVTWAMSLVKSADRENEVNRLLSISRYWGSVYDRLNNEKISDEDLYVYFKKMIQDLGYNIEGEEKLGTYYAFTYYTSGKNVAIYIVDDLNNETVKETIESVEKYIEGYDNSCLIVANKRHSTYYGRVKRAIWLDLYTVREMKKDANELYRSYNEKYNTALREKERRELLEEVDRRNAANYWMMHNHYNTFHNDCDCDNCKHDKK